MKMTWHEARAYCISLDNTTESSDLVTILTKAQSYWLGTQMPNVDYDDEDTLAWIGAHHHKTDWIGTYVWARTDEPISDTFSNWLQIVLGNLP